MNGLQKLSCIYNLLLDHFIVYQNFTLKIDLPSTERNNIKTVTKSETHFVPYSLEQNSCLTDNVVRTKPRCGYLAIKVKAMCGKKIF